ncbi:MAG: glutamate formimidoyltransferase [Syntrophus sp. (in: bacteria)]|nr:glutamate formimidoyltransferase [Syntrophus sp. (in: bacteria)]
MIIIECVPNFSEGRDRKKGQALVDAAAAVEGIKLLDFCMDEDHHRSVLTFIGSPGAVQEACLAVCLKAIGIIDMREHAGVHPRIGAVDVVPFIPLGDADMSDAVRIAHDFGHEFAEQFQLPVYFYGEAALTPARRELSHIRKGGYEALRQRCNAPGWRPDAGPNLFNECAGATAVGARLPLIAFNINLKSDNLPLAQDIARRIRQSSGGLPQVKAIGLLLKSRRVVQVSMNLTDYRVTSLRTVFDRVREEAARRNTDILESELIGLIPGAALADVTADYLKLKEFSDQKILESHF